MTGNDVGAGFKHIDVVDRERILNKILNANWLFGDRDSIAMTLLLDLSRMWYIDEVLNEGILCVISILVRSFCHYMCCPVTSKCSEMSILQ